MYASSTYFYFLGTEICSNETYQNISKYLIDTVSAILPGGGVGLDDIGKFLNDFYFPTEYAAEIKGCAAALGVSYGWVTLLNIGYEVSDACTSIVAQTPDGKILHARNLDFWDGMGFTDSLKMMAFQVCTLVFLLLILVRLNGKREESPSSPQLRSLDSLAF